VVKKGIDDVTSYYGSLPWGRALEPSQAFAFAFALAFDCRWWTDASFAGRTGREVHALDATTPVEVIEWPVPLGKRSPRRGTDLARAAHAGWYAHVVDGEHIIVVFPGEHQIISRGDEAAVRAHWASRSAARSQRVSAPEGSRSCRDAPS
jgi:hypothetical protein